MDLLGFSQLFTLMFPLNLMQGVGDCRRGKVDVPSTYDLFINLRAGGLADASTGWAVAPWRTAVGGAIHLADPHNLLDIATPEFRMHAGELEFAGFVVGLLFVGHLRHVAWSTTFGSPDVADCHAIQTDAGNPNTYKADDESRRIHGEVVHIAVRGEPARALTIEYAIVNEVRTPLRRVPQNKRHPRPSTPGGP